MKKLYALLFVFILIFINLQPAHAQQSVLNVYYAGEDGPLKTALVLAGYNLVDDPSQADVVVINGVYPSGPLPPGVGRLVILGEGLTQMQVSELLYVPLELTFLEDPVSLTDLKGLDDPLLTEIVWNGAPQVRQRYGMMTPMSSVQPLVVSYETGDWLLWRASTNAYVINFLLDGSNPQVQEWPYYNYLIYHLVERAAGRTPLSFADYPASPVPHAQDRLFLFIFLALIFITAVGLFILVRRHSLRHPEALDDLVADREKFQSREAGTEWEQIGFHRPLSGLLVGMTTGVVLFIPLIIYQNLILPQFILPSAQALGIWGRVTQFFGVAWTLFDVGTAMASMKFLSQYRVNEPRRGIQYMQFYVWWQALSGAVQIAMVVAFASTGLVRTPYALFTWSIIIHTMIQIPGFYQVMRNTLNALQRTDYARYLDNIATLLMPMLVQPVFVSIFYLLGKQHPSIGAALGGVIGLGVSAYMIELFTFMIGFWMYKRLGYNARVLFMAHFDKKVIKESFTFGIFEMAGGLIITAGGAIEIWITQSRLINYTEIWGNWGLAQNFIFAFTVATNLYDGVMPAVSEAISSGRKKLCQYYAVQSYKWGGVTSAFLAAMLLVIAPRFILGSSGMEFQRAAVYVIPLIIFGSFQYLTWTGDSILLGANKPRIRAVLILVEQSIRVVLAYLLLERFQVTALVIAYLVGILVRGIVVYFVTNRVAFQQKFYFWQMVAAPLLAAGIHFLWLNEFAKIVWQGDEITSILLFLFGLLVSLPIYMFIYSLVGGWDEATLHELEEAKNMTGFLRRLVQVLFWYPARFGARISPLNNRFPITIFAEAMEEANSLTAAKVKL